MTEATAQERGELLWRVYWPGQATVACEHHKRQLEGLARSMGWQVRSDLLAEPGKCANCENEAQGRKPNARVL